MFSFKVSVLFFFYNYDSTNDHSQNIVTKFDKVSGCDKMFQFKLSRLIFFFLFTRLLKCELVTVSSPVVCFHSSSRTGCDLFSYDSFTEAAISYCTINHRNKAMTSKVHSVLVLFSQLQKVGESFLCEISWPPLVSCWRGYRWRSNWRWEKWPQSILTVRQMLQVEEQSCCLL